MIRNAILFSLGCGLLVAVTGCCCGRCGCNNNPAYGPYQGDCGSDCCPPTCHPIRDKLAGCGCENCCESGCCCGRCCGCCDTCDPCGDPCCPGHCCFSLITAPVRWVVGLFRCDGCCGPGCCGCGCCGGQCYDGQPNGWGPYESNGLGSGGGCSHCNNGYGYNGNPNTGFAYDRANQGQGTGVRSYNSYAGSNRVSDNSRANNSYTTTVNSGSRINRNATLSDDPGTLADGGDAVLQPASDAPHRAPRPQGQ